MPVRFVEVTNLADAARTTEAFSYLKGLQNRSWTPFLSAFANDGPHSNETTGLLTRLATAAQRAQAPAGGAKYLMLSALLLLALRQVLVRAQTRRALSEYGTAAGR